MLQQEKTAHTERWLARQAHSIPRQRQAGRRQIKPREQTHTLPDRTAGRPGNASTGQYSAGVQTWWIPKTNLGSDPKDLDPRSSGVIDPNMLFCREIHVPFFMRDPLGFDISYLCI